MHYKYNNHSRLQTMHCPYKDNNIFNAMELMDFQGFFKFFNSFHFLSGFKGKGSETAKWILNWKYL